MVQELNPKSIYIYNACFSGLHVNGLSLHHILETVCWTCCDTDKDVGDNLSKVYLHKKRVLIVTHFKRWVGAKVPKLHLYRQTSGLKNLHSSFWNWTPLACRCDKKWFAGLPCDSIRATCHSSARNQSASFLTKAVSEFQVDVARLHYFQINSDGLSAMTVTSPIHHAPSAVGINRLCNFIHLLRAGYRIESIRLWKYNLLFDLDLLKSSPPKSILIRRLMPRRAIIFVVSLLNLNKFILAWISPECLPGALLPEHIHWCFVQAWPLNSSCKVFLRVGETHYSRSRFLNTVLFQIIVNKIYK